MAKTIKLASVLLKCGQGSRGADEKQGAGGNVLNIFLLICLAPIVYYLFQAGVFLQELLGAMDTDGVILGFILLVVSVFIFCIGIVSCINSFYLSSNINILLVMPFSAAQITGAKFLVAAVYEYYISFAVLAPLLIGYGYAGKATLLYWIGAALTVILVPIVPLAFACIVAMAIMRFVGVAKNKEHMTAFGAVGVILLTVIYQIVRSSTSGLKASDVGNTIGHMAKQLHDLTWMFPEIPFLTNGMEGGSWLSLFFALLVAVVIYLVFLVVAKAIYMAGAVGIQQGSAAHKQMTEKQMEAHIKQKSVLKSYTSKELHAIFRTPAYYVNCLFITLGWPVVVIVPMLFSKSQTGVITMVEQNLLQPDKPISFLLTLFVAVFSATAMAAAVNGIAVSAVSREGQGYQIMKQLPVPYKTQLKAKRNSAFIVCWIGSGGYLLLAGLYLVFTASLPWWSIPLGLVWNALLLIIILDLEMILGLIKPSLSWESEANAINGKISFILLLVCIVVGVLLVAVGSDWVESLSISAIVFGVAVFLGLFVVSFLMERLFYWYGQRKMDRL